METNAETYYNRPYIAEDYALRTRPGTIRKDTASEVVAMLTEAARDTCYASDMAESWACDNVEPHREDYEAMASIIAGFGKVMAEAAVFIGENAPDRITVAAYLGAIGQADGDGIEYDPEALGFVADRGETI